MKTIKERLTEEIKSSGLTTVEIGKRVGIDSSMITKYKTTNKMPSLETFALLCKVIDASADYILGLTDEAGKKITE